ncbi:MAG TPA: hypothetical protein VJX67_13665, partial [Blastocatellia bacterium]|nr:hypothetical protein [Blastocatellia bacterium]
MAQRRRANALKFKKGKGLKLAVTLIFSAALIAIPLRASSQTPAITPKNSIDQTMLERGKYTFARVLSSGGDFFSTPYTPFDRDTGEGDGHGEGPNGPRSQQIQAFYKDHPGYPFLRLNGIDSQSCYECHNSIGSFEGYQGAQMRTPYSVGGSAGANSNAFINPAFPNPLTTFIRNPPHVFGAGYTQEVAAEMTEELQTEVAVARSISKITKQPKTVDLEAKGMSFGKFTTTYTGGPGQVNGCPQGELCGQYPAMLQVEGYTDDVSQVTGIECDIVVRPLQWKGIASSIRHFVRDALDFHFSMQAE